jgi:predicted PurR-regulated permease PerM
VSTSHSSTSIRPLITLAGVVLVVAILYWARVVLVPLALATFFAFILGPAVNALQRRGPGRITSVLIVVLLAAALVGGIGYFVGNQLAGLAQRLPEYQGQIVTKVQSLSNIEGGGLIQRVRQTVEDINQRVNEANDKAQPTTPADSIAEPPPGSTPDTPLYTRLVESGWTGVAGYAGPAAEILASSLLVLVMVVFMLVQRENLRNRLVWLIGHGRLIVTTRAIDEGARRISRFLVMQLCVNAGFGVALAVALVAISFFAPEADDASTMRHYAILWGFICGLMRFVPYLGTWVGAALLVGFSVATLHGWTLPIVIFGVFLVLELAGANVVEPLLFGHSTGISPLALLLSAAFWAWLWGPIGLLLSTPLTVVLIVLGKYVPQLRFFEVILGDEPILNSHIVLYQRLVANDLDEASELVEEYSKSHSPEDTYQDLFLPTLMLTRQDLDRGELDEEDARQMFRMLNELIDDMAPPPVSTPADGGPAPSVTVLGCPGRDRLDELALVMFGHLMRAQSRPVEVVSSEVLTAEVMEKVGETGPGVVVIASVPSGGLAQARYLCKRIKAQWPAIKIVVGRWGPRGQDERMQERLTAAGADKVSTTLAESRAEVIALLQVADAGKSAEPRKATTELVAH